MVYLFNKEANRLTNKITHFHELPIEVQDLLFHYIHTTYKLRVHINHNVTTYYVRHHFIELLKESHREWLKLDIALGCFKEAMEFWGFRSMWIDDNPDSGSDWAFNSRIVR